MADCGGLPQVVQVGLIPFQSQNVGLNYKFALIQVLFDNVHIGGGYHHWVPNSIQIDSVRDISIIIPILLGYESDYQGTDAANCTSNLVHYKKNNNLKMTPEQLHALSPVSYPVNYCNTHACPFLKPVLEGLVWIWNQNTSNWRFYLPLQIIFLHRWIPDFPSEFSDWGRYFLTFLFALRTLEAGSLHI